MHDVEMIWEAYVAKNNASDEEILKSLIKLQLTPEEWAEVERIIKGNDELQHEAIELTEMSLKDAIKYAKTHTLTVAAAASLLMSACSKPTPTPKLNEWQIELAHKAQGMYSDDIKKKISDLKYALHPHNTQHLDQKDIDKKKMFLQAYEYALTLMNSNSSDKGKLASL